MPQGQTWAVVLAAGNGCRLRELTTAANGIHVPKQFCSFRSQDSLLQCAIHRVKRHVPRERVIVIVAAEHRLWWEPELLGIPSENILVQPKNCGTAPGVLFPLMSIWARDPKAKVLFLPSDHYVTDEHVLEQAIAGALRAQEERIVLLGMTADAPDTEYGWIIPSHFSRVDMFLRRVSFFAEKPNAERACELLHNGGLWNSFIFSGQMQSFLDLYADFPELLKLYMNFFALPEAERRFERLVMLYENTPTLDFSRNLLEKSVEKLLVLAVSPCGWSDLGTPERAVRVWQQMSKQQKTNGEKVFTLPHHVQESQSSQLFL